MSVRPLSSSSQEPLLKKRKQNVKTPSEPEIAVKRDTLTSSQDHPITATQQPSTLSQSQRETQIISSIPLSEIYSIDTLQSQPKETQFSITKNCKMSHKIDQIFKSLEHQLQDHAESTLLMAHGVHLARLLSIVEILKAKIHEKLGDKAKWVQFNRLEKIERSYEVDELTTKTLKIPVLYVLFNVVDDKDVGRDLKGSKEWTLQEF